LLEVKNMNICPVCQRGYSDSVEICPSDSAPLERYDLRAELRARRKREIFTGLVEERLLTRLSRELSAARREFRDHPRLFLKDMFQGENDLQYRRSLGRSTALALIAINTCLSVMILVFGVLKPAAAKTERPVRPEPPGGNQLPPEVTLLKFNSPASARRGRHTGGRVGGSLSSRQEGRGGGGGGAGENVPAPRGITAPAILLPQVAPSQIELAKMENAPLITPMTVYADPRSMPPAGPVGDPEGVTASRGRGPGQNGGLGRGRDGGIGPGTGLGFGPGFYGGTGGKSFIPGGGPTTGPSNGGDIPWASARVKPTITYKEKARYTEEARLKHVQGTVVLKATFTADGRITDISVIHGLPDGLTEKAIEAAHRIRFQPALRDGVPVSVRASLEYNFMLY
jgi:TonB family protein